MLRSNGNFEILSFEAVLQIWSCGPGNSSLIGINVKDTKVRKNCRNIQFPCSRGNTFANN